jgi:hypothetical protein
MVIYLFGAQQRKMSKCLFLLESYHLMYTLLRFDLTAHKLQSPRWQAKTIQLDNAARANVEMLMKSATGQFS